MHKKETNLKHSKIANDMLNYINNNIDTDINIDQLAVDFGVNKFHLHKVFKEQMGMNIYETIKSLRLQKASNLLITNKYSTITQIASMCGYSSQTSFIRAFKKRFNQTPKIWRKGGYEDYSNEILANSDFENLKDTDFPNLEPKIVKTQEMLAYYIRHKGYDKDTKKTWQKMMAWVYSHNIEYYQQIGIYHDNPIITPLKDCHYVACISPQEKVDFKDLTLPYFTIPTELCALFEVEGKYGDILKLIQWVYHIWLPDSGYEALATASYSIIHKNHFLNDDGIFKLSYYVPIRFV
ncbi:MAG: AraC family transcriptional regulator [Campylobacterota bacterium]|nr:AraC family transcriptional regulator [Campylobacterota bacterium]